jgi:prolyl-tRNA synthetase
MFLSKLFLPLTKDLPADAKIKSHQLMLRTCMIKQSAAGIYSWLPLGFKVMKKIEQIVREEQKKNRRPGDADANDSIRRYLEGKWKIQRLW